MEDQEKSSSETQVEKSEPEIVGNSGVGEHVTSGEAAKDEVRAACAATATEVDAAAAVAADVVVTGVQAACVVTAAEADATAVASAVVVTEVQAVNVVAEREEEVEEVKKEEDVEKKNEGEKEEEEEREREGATCADDDDVIGADGIAGKLEEVKVAGGEAPGGMDDVEISTGTKEGSGKKDEEQKSHGPSESAKQEIETETKSESPALPEEVADDAVLADVGGPAVAVAETKADSTPKKDSTPVEIPAGNPVADPAASSPEDESKRRGSIEKMSNYLRQFRNSGGFKKFTASQFMKVWNHYDDDGNGFISGTELDGFLREFVISSVNEDQVRPEILSDSAMAHFKETFMDAFDENQDGMIDIAELAEILPTDENFLLLFHLKNPVESSVEFMRIWRQYDRNCKGYIESKELKSFLKHMLDNQKTTVSDDKLNEYTETILNLFDSNRDGKLQLCEMARLMPVKQNFLSKPILKGASCITRSDIDRLFRIYDQNRNGTIEDEELSGLLKDLMDLGKKDYSLEDIENMKKIIMDHWDLDQDGTISKSELRMFLVQQCKLSAESQGLQYDDEDGDDDDDDYD